MKKHFVLKGAGKPKSTFHSFKFETHKKPQNIPIYATKNHKFHADKIINNNAQENLLKNFSQDNFNEEKNNIGNNSNNNNILINGFDKENDNNENQYHNGRWTEEEHQKFIDGILEFGNEWKKVQQIIKTRSSTQARSHAQKFFLRIKKIIKNNGGDFNDKEKIIEIIINNCMPNKKVNSLTRTQKEKLLSAISSNVKYEETNNKQYDFGGENGLEEDNLQYNKKDDNYIDKILDNNHENIKDNNSFIGNKRKQTDNYSIRDNKIFSIHKDLSHRSSIDITFQKIANSQEIKDNNNIKDNNSRNNNKDLNKDSVIKNNLLSIKNNNNDNTDNKNNMNGFIINNYINVTNNFMNNNYIYNLPNPNNSNFNFHMMNNANVYYIQDSQIINCEKSDDKYQNYNQNNHFSRNNFINFRFNNFNDYENINNNQNDPFKLEFCYCDKNIINNENEQQISINEDEFIKINDNNNDENPSYN